MKKFFVITGIFALLVAFGPLDASAQGKGKGKGGGAPSTQGSELKGLDRADQAAGPHGAKGRAKARTRGANKGFCPPGQEKKAGLGSRFKC